MDLEGRIQSVLEGAFRVHLMIISVIMVIP